MCWARSTCRASWCPRLTSVNYWHYLYLLGRPPSYCSYVRVYRCWFIAKQASNCDPFDSFISLLCDPHELDLLSSGLLFLTFMRIYSAIMQWEYPSVFLVNRMLEKSDFLRFRQDKNHFFKNTHNSIQMIHRYAWYTWVALVSIHSPIETLFFG